MRTTSDRPFSSAAANNAKPILEILRHEFQNVTTVLEIGSGTGQHAVSFASELKFLDWQTSDLEENHPGIVAWLDDANLSNVRAPVLLDVSLDESIADSAAKYDAVYSSNTAHIMSFDAVSRMFELVGKVLRSGGVFCLYGPFRRFGQFNTPSNAQFDASLRSRDAAMGIRDLESLDELAAAHALQRTGLYAVPSNNQVVLWQKMQQKAQ